MRARTLRPCIYCGEPTTFRNNIREPRCLTCSDFVHKAMRLRHRPAIIVTMLMAANVPPLELADAAKEACP